MKKTKWINSIGLFMFIACLIVSVFCTSPATALLLIGSMGTMMYCYSEKVSK